VLTARRVDVLESLAAETGGRAIACDLGDRAAVERLVADAGPIDVLVANAGLSLSRKIQNTSVEEIDRLLDINLRAPMVLARMLIDGMSERGGGHIVFVSSLNGKAGTVGASAYSATKFGLRGYAQGIRADLRSRGIGVSTIFPGFIRDAGMFHDSGATLPPFVGTKRPEDVAKAVIHAIEHDRSEVDVAPLPMRIGTTIASLAPETAATVQRKLGAEEIASRVEDGQRG
jgi:uncharacterized protein